MFETRRMFSGFRSVWTRLRSWRTAHRLAYIWCVSQNRKLTGDAGKELSSKALNVGAGEWCEVVPLQEVKDAFAEKVCDNADVISVVEAFPEMDASIPIVLVVGVECRKYS